MGTLLDMELSIQKLDRMQKFDNFLSVLAHFRVERCKIDECQQCKFAANLRFCYIQNNILEGIGLQNSGIYHLQQYCGLKHVQYNYARLFLEHLSKIEKKELNWKKKHYQRVINNETFFS